MARPTTIESPELLDRLSGVFRDVGYEGASIAMLSEATGLKRASLYHRFPNGKEQMAKEVLTSAQNWLTENIFQPLGSSAPAKKRVALLAEKLDALYSGGRQACILNMLSAAHIYEGPFTVQIRQIFEAFIDALETVAHDAGQDRKTARKRAEQTVAMLQGSLVLARGMGTTEPFVSFLKSLPAMLLDPTKAG